MDPEGLLEAAADHASELADLVSEAMDELAAENADWADEAWDILDSLPSLEDVEGKIRGALKRTVTGYTSPNFVRGG